MAIQPDRLWADLHMDEPADEKDHVRSSRACSAARARVTAALRPVAAQGDLEEGSPHFESIEHCESLFARGEWFLSLGQPETAQTFFTEGSRALRVIVQNLSANLGTRVEPVVVAGSWDEINIRSPGALRRGGAFLAALSGRGRSARVF